VGGPFSKAHRHLLGFIGLTNVDVPLIEDAALCLDKAKAANNPFYSTLITFLKKENL
jgi:hypothetical protein